MSNKVANGYCANGDQDTDEIFYDGHVPETNK